MAKRSFSIKLTLFLLMTLMMAACVRPAPRPTETATGTEVPVVPPPATLTPTTEPQPTIAAPEATAVDGTAVEGDVTPVPGSSVNENGERIHEIQSGETLSQLSVIYGVSVDEIMTANGLNNPDSLELGQVLIIPNPGEAVAPTTTAPAANATATPGTAVEQVHIVQAGENLYRIGLQYGFTVNELAEYNNMANPDSLEVGQEIRIPPQN